MQLKPVGILHSELKSRKNAPRQRDGAPDAWIEFDPAYRVALGRLVVGDDIIVLTWLHEANRETLEVRPGGDPATPLHGVFATRSPDRPNPIGIHPCVVRAIEGDRVLVGPIEAIDGTPVVDVKIELCGRPR